MIDELDLTAEESLLDCGAGVGGPAAYGRAGGGRDAAARRTRGRGLPRGPDSVRLPRCGRSDPRWPLVDATVDAAWSLGVLCTTPHQLELLTELRRTVRSRDIALLAFVARQSVSDEQPEGNYFPSVDRLTQLVNDAGLRIHA